MPPQVIGARLRLQVFCGQNISIKDALTGETPVFWRGNNVRLELGLFFGPPSGAEVMDVSNLTSITIEAKQSQTSLGSPLISKTVTAEDLDNTLDAATWTDRTKQHIAIELTDAETNLDLDGEAEDNFWLTVSCVTDEGKKCTLGVSSLRVREDNAGVAGTPPTNDPTYLTAAETSALVDSKAEAADLEALDDRVDDVDADLANVEAVTIAVQDANKVFAGPASGAGAAPTYRALVSDDIPALATSKITGLDGALAGKAAASHVHAAADITSGTLDLARLPDIPVTKLDATGTTDDTTFLRGDGTWAMPESAGAVEWGDVAGTLTDQADLVAALAGKASTSHAASHAGGGSDAIATAIAAGAAGLMSGTDKAKLDGVATGANNYTHPNHTGDVTSTGDGATAIAAGVIVNADVNASAAIALSKLAAIGAATLIGNNTGGSAVPIELSASQVRTLLALVIGTNVQAWDTDLDALAGLSSTGILRRLGSGSASAGTAVSLTTEVTGTLPVGNGGTGATTASAARTALGLAIGTDVQAYDTDLAAIAALSPSSGNVITWNGSAWIASAPSGGGDRAIAQCRLSLSSALPVSGNITGSGDVYLHRYRGNRIAVYSGSGSVWTELTLGSSAISLSLTAFTTAGRPVDIFVSNSGGSPVLNGIAWSSSTARATNLTLQDGIYVNSADLTQRYVGSVCIVSSGVADDNETNRYCWSMYNQVDRVAIAKESTDTWTYTTATFREIRAGAGGAGASRVNILKGLAEPIDVSVKGLAISSTTVSVACGVGVNSDTNLSPVFGTQAISTGYVSVIAAYRGEVPEGANNVRMLEYSVATGTTTWGGDVGIPAVLQSGMWVYTRQ